MNHAVAQRLALDRFGKASNAKENATTTTVGENFRVKLQPASARQNTKEQEEDQMGDLKSKLQNRTITCRLCSGGHYTSRCPYKDTLSGVLPGADDAAGVDAAGLPVDAAAPGAMSSSGKYVPPSIRFGAKGGGETMFRNNRDDLPTLRVTNLSEDVVEQDLWDLFGRFAQFARLQRIFVGRDQETGNCKGFAFVSFEDKRDAEKAMSKIDGMPYGQSICILRLMHLANVAATTPLQTILSFRVHGVCPVANGRKGDGHRVFPCLADLAVQALVKRNALQLSFLCANFPSVLSCHCCLCPFPCCPPDLGSIGNSQTSSRRFYRLVCFTF